MKFVVPPSNAKIRAVNLTANWATRLRANGNLVDQCADFVRSCNKHSRFRLDDDIFGDFVKCLLFEANLCTNYFVIFIEQLCGVTYRNVFVLKKNHWTSPNRPVTSEETVLGRLRIGHTHLTHFHLIPFIPSFLHLAYTVSKKISLSNTSFHVPHFNLSEPTSRYRFPSSKHSKITSLLPPSPCNFRKPLVSSPSTSTIKRRANNPGS